MNSVKESAIAIGNGASATNISVANKMTLQEKTARVILHVYEEHRHETNIGLSNVLKELGMDDSSNERRLIAGRMEQIGLDVFRLTSDNHFQIKLDAAFFSVIENSKQDGQQPSSSIIVNHGTITNSPFVSNSQRTKISYTTDTSFQENLKRLEKAIQEMRIEDTEFKIELLEVLKKVSTGEEEPSVLKYLFQKLSKYGSAAADAIQIGSFLSSV